MYVLDHSGSFDMHIEKLFKKVFFFKICSRGGEAQNVTDWSATIRCAFFTLSHKHRTQGDAVIVMYSMKQNYLSGLYPPY